MQQIHGQLQDWVRQGSMNSATDQERKAGKKIGRVPLRLLQTERKFFLPFPALLEIRKPLLVEHQKQMGHNERRKWQNTIEFTIY